MKYPRTRTSILLLGAWVLPATIPAAQAEDYVTGTLATTSSRCADFGEGFIDMGNGVCARVGNPTRVQLGSRGVGATGWTTGGTSDAALRSTDGLIPGTGVQHLRVRNGLEASPFQ